MVDTPPTCYKCRFPMRRGEYLVERVNGELCTVHRLPRRCRETIAVAKAKAEIAARKEQQP